MQRMDHGVLKIFLLLTILVGAPLYAKSAAAQTEQRFVYAVKFVCGGVLVGGAERVASGAYFTDINIQKANIAGTMEMTVRPAVGKGLFSQTGPGEIGDTVTEDLVGGEVKSIDCQQIESLLNTVPASATRPRTGFLQITSQAKLAVVAVYSAQSCAQTSRQPWFVNGFGRSGQGCSGEVTLDVEIYEPILVEDFEPPTEPPF